MDYSRNIKILTWQGFLVGFSLWAPIAAIYFAKVSGSYTLGLSIFSIIMVSGALFEVPTGIFSDLIGRKWTTILGGFFYALGGLFFAVGTNYLFLALGALSEGLARAFYSGNNDALLYDSLEKSSRKEELVKFIGNIGGAEQWALGVSALVGGIMAAKYSYALVVWLSLIPLIISFVLGFWLKEVPNTEKHEGNVYSHLKESWKNFVNNKKLRLLSLSEIIGYGFSEASWQFGTVFIASLWPAWAIGLGRMLSNFGAAISFWFSEKLIKRFNEIQILMFDKVVSKAITFYSLFFPTVFSPTIMSTTSLLYGPSEVAQRSLLQREFTNKQRATMGSLNSFGKSIFFGIAAMIIGYIADKTTPRIALIYGQLFGMFSLWLTWKLVKLIKKERSLAATI